MPLRLRSTSKNLYRGLGFSDTEADVHRLLFASVPLVKSDR
jgi:hypothetical protein